MHLYPFFYPRMDLSKQTEGMQSLERLGTGEGEDLVLQMERNAGRKKNPNT